MITSQEHTGFIKVEEYSLASWLAEVETVINQGYTFDFESNENYPQAYGSLYTVILVPVKAKTETLFGKKNTEVVAPPDAEVDTVVKTQSEAQQEAVIAPKVDGRKKK